MLCWLFSAYVVENYPEVFLHLLQAVALELMSHEHHI